MLYLDKPKKIFLYCDPIDFRKQKNGLCLIAEADHPKEIFSGSWFVFTSKDKKKVKILYWRNTGFALWYFLLEKGIFNLSRPRVIGQRTVNWKDLERFLAGYNIFEGQPHDKIIGNRFS